MPITRILIAAVHLAATGAAVPITGVLVAALLVMGIEVAAMLVAKV